MKTLMRYAPALLLVGLLLCTEAGAQEQVKLAQTGMQFLSVVSDARAGALAGAVTTLPLGSSSLFFNPACMTEGNMVEAAVSINQWIADIKHTTFSIAYKPAHGDYGVVGLSVQSVNYGEILGTAVGSGGTDYVDIGTIDVSSLAVGLGYAIALSEQFSVGAHVRWVKQDLGQSQVVNADSTTSTYNNKKNPFVVDFGTLFKTGFKSLAFGMSVRNFSTEVTYVRESFELPLTITLGLSMDMMDFAGDRSIVNSVLVSVDAVHNRDYREQVFLGAECTVMKLLALRGGLITNSDEDRWTFGFGVSQFGLAVDYAYTPFGIFNNVQRVSVRFSM